VDLPLVQQFQLCLAHLLQSLQSPQECGLRPVRFLSFIDTVVSIELTRARFQEGQGRLELPELSQLQLFVSVVVQQVSAASLLLSCSR